MDTSWMSHSCVAIAVIGSIAIVHTVCKTVFKINQLESRIIDLEDLCKIRNIYPCSTREKDLALRRLRAPQTPRKRSMFLKRSFD